MKKYYSVIILILLFLGVDAQVGISTQYPKATLHVGKKQDLTFADGIIPPRISGDSLRLKKAAYTFAQHGALLYVTSPVTNPNPINDPKTQDVGSTGFFMYDAYYTHLNNTQGIWNKIAVTDLGTSSGTYAAKFDGSITLLQLGLGLFDNNFLSLPLSTTSSIITNEIASPQIINNEYVVPYSGIYQINYSYRTDQGLSAQLLSGGNPGVAILKIAADNTQSILDFRIFGGINLLVAQVTLTQGQISHIYNLKAGEKLRFGILRGGINLSLLASRSAEISIYKIR